MKKMSSTSQKHKNFVMEPMGDKAVTELAGMGPVLGGKLEEAGFDKAYVVLGQYLVLRKDEELFKEWLKDITGANKKQQNDCYTCLKEWSEYLACTDHAEFRLQKKEDNSIEQICTEWCDSPIQTRTDFYRDWQQNDSYHKCLVAEDTLDSVGVWRPDARLNHSTTTQRDDSLAMKSYYEPHSMSYELQQFIMTQNPYLESRSVSEPSPVSATLLGLELLWLPGDKAPIRVSDSGLAAILADGVWTAAGNVDWVLADSGLVSISMSCEPVTSGVIEGSSLGSLRPESTELVSELFLPSFSGCSRSGTEPKVESLAPHLERGRRFAPCGVSSNSSSSNVRLCRDFEWLLFRLLPYDDRLNAGALSSFTSRGAENRDVFFLTSPDILLEAVGPDVLPPALSVGVTRPPALSSGSVRGRGWEGAPREDVGVVDTPSLLPRLLTLQELAVTTKGVQPVTVKGSVLRDSDGGLWLRFQLHLHPAPLPGCRGPFGTSPCRPQSRRHRHLQLSITDWMSISSTHSPPRSNIVTLYNKHCSISGLTKPPTTSPSSTAGRPPDIFSSNFSGLSKALTPGAKSVRVGRGARVGAEVSSPSSRDPLRTNVDWARRGLVLVPPRRSTSSMFIDFARIPANDRVNTRRLFQSTARGPMLQQVKQENAAAGSDQQATANPNHSSISPKKFAPDTSSNIPPATDNKYVGTYTPPVLTYPQMRPCPPLGTILCVVQDVGGLQIPIHQAEHQRHGERHKRRRLAALDQEREDARPEHIGTNISSIDIYMRSGRQGS
ncbi:BAF-like protein [Mya arenaria]|uniref:BAF-like protein n=1 Tax=Mya arenaria TaxID=6604 RepID=A0ABY7FBP9_MYAAR|nr:BAF-like protein [Mya arenaria]